MVDTVTPEKRSRMMAAIRSKDTGPEITIRKGLHAKGFRYRLHVKKLPGKPDMVFKSRNAVIQIHGCFWHGHDCALFKWPKSNSEFWHAKITANKIRDRKNIDALRKLGWRVLIVYECAIKNKPEKEINAIIEKIADFLGKDSEYATIDETGHESQ